MNAPISIQRSDGTSARLEEDALVLRDPQGRLLLRVDDDGLRIEAITGDLTLAAPQGRVVVEAEEEVCLRSRRLTSVADEIVQRAGRWELEAERMVERAGDAFRQVEGTLQVRAGRARHLIEGAFQLFSRRTTVTSEDDVTIDGQQIRLG